MIIPRLLPATAPVMPTKDLMKNTVFAITAAADAPPVGKRLPELPPEPLP